jgi:putative ABC transport system permease protein
MLIAILRQALDTMWQHRRWAALTMFGIVWGTASVVLLVGWGVGVHAMLERSMQKVGKNLVYVWPGRIGEDVSPAEERRKLWIDLEDVDAVRGSAHTIAVASAEIQAWVRARYGSSGRTVDLRGVEVVMKDLRGLSLAAGRFFSPDDVRLERRVAVIGEKARERLLGARPVLGESLNLSGQSFTVIGLFEPVGAQLNRDGADLDEQIWIPLSTAKVLLAREHIDRILIRAKERRLNDQLKREVRAILADRLHVSPHDEEAIFMLSIMEYLAGFDSVFATLNVFLMLLAVGTLAIGGIGVMNMMLVSVNERRREIGLRLAVGARRDQVVAQFLVETLAITLVGGLSGLTLGVAGCLVLGRLPKDVIPVPEIVPSVVVAAIGVTVVVGLLSGIGPAWRTAGIDPAESLRAE